MRVALTLAGALLLAVALAITIVLATVTVRNSGVWQYAAICMAAVAFSLLMF